MFLICFCFALPLLAQDAGTPDKETTSKIFSKPPYSPYAGRNFPTRPFFGDTHLHTSLSEDPAIELPWEPQLTVTPFRLAGADDDANRGFLARINASSRVYLSSTSVRGRYMIRACILSHRTHRDRIDECIDIVRTAAAVTN
jgi:hypothetical protein